MRKKFLTIIMVFMVGSAMTQTKYHISNYGGNGEYYNPAVIGSYNGLNAAVLWRSQWVGVAGAPKVGMASVFAPVKGSSSSLGALLSYDNVGFNSRTNLNILYSYKVQLSQGHFMAIGTGLGMNYHAQDISKLDVDPDDSYFINNVGNKIIFDGNIGAFFFGDGYYAGVSANNVFDQGHFNLSGGYTFRLNGSFDIIPSMLLKATKSAPVQTDINCQLLYNKQVGLGLSYRTAGDLVVLLDLKLNNQMKFGYAFDANLMNKGIGRSVTGSHEIYMRYSVEKAGNLAKVFIPRF